MGPVPGAGSPARLPMADAHNDLLLGVLHERERGHDDPFGSFWLPELRAGGVVLQVLPIYTEAQFLGEAALRRALLVIEAARELAARHAAEVAIVERGADLRPVIASGRIALVLAFEGLEPVGGDVAILETFFRLGVRIASLTWNRRTMMADGAGEGDTGGGLTTTGVAAVAAMERLGMLLDVSHLSDPGLAHVRRIATRPFIASHSSCRALRDHPRNLPDAAIAAIGAAGGFVGLNAYGGFLAPAAPTVDDFLRHVAHAVAVAGADRVALGMDFVDDLFARTDPILGGVLLTPDQLGTVAGLRRPSELAALGERMVAVLGEPVARAVAAETMIDRLAALLP